MNREPAGAGTRNPPGQQGGTTALEKELQDSGTEPARRRTPPPGTAELQDWDGNLLGTQAKPSEPRTSFDRGTGQAGFKKVWRIYHITLQQI